MIRMPSALSRLAVALTVLALAGCASIPYERNGIIPAEVAPPDGSAERTRLNAQVYDAVVDYTARLFYKRDFGGVPFEIEARNRRAAAIAQPDSAGLHGDLAELLDLLDDDHTNTLSPRERELVRQREEGQSRAGWGIVVTPRGDDPVVAAVLPNTPAAEAGVLPGWRIETVDGYGPLQARPPVAGRENLIVFVDEADQRHERRMTAVLIPPRALFETRTLDDGVAYLRFDDFDWTRFEQFEAAFEAMKDDPPPGLIIDLRTNGGGQLNLVALSLAWLFEQKQDVVVTKGRFIDRRWNVDAGAHPYSGPVVMLIGPGSASGAELMAAVAQEKGRAVLVGDVTRGAVTGTRGINLPDGGLLRVGQLVMTTPAGTNLEKVGARPDIPVPDDWIAVREGRDPVLEAGLEALRDRREAASVADDADPG